MANKLLGMFMTATKIFFRIAKLIVVLNVLRIPALDHASCQDLFRIFSEVGFKFVDCTMKMSVWTLSDLRLSCSTLKGLKDC